MSRYLFVVPPLAGHVNPAAGVAAELKRRGHQIAWVAHEPVVGSLLGEGARIYPAGERFLVDIAHHLGERDRLRGPSALKFLWERVLIPLAVDMAGPVRGAVEDFRPDVLVTDQQAFAGAIVGEELGLPWAVSASTSADLVDPLQMVPKVALWMRDRLDDLCDRVGSSHLLARGFDPRRSPHLVIVYSTPAFVGEDVSDTKPLAFVGPVLPGRPSPAPSFPEGWLDRHETNVFVSLGTVSHGIGGRFLRTVLDAVAGAPYGVVMVAPEDLAGAAPGNVLVRSYVPQPALLPKMDAVLCHAGHNTSVEALACGVPVVCAPIRDDQPITAGQVVRAGAGLRVSFARARPNDISEALDEVLREPAYRSSAAALARSFHDAGGAPAAAARLEALV